VTAVCLSGLCSRSTDGSILCRIDSFTRSLLRILGRFFSREALARIVGSTLKGGKLACGSLAGERLAFGSLARGKLVVESLARGKLAAESLARGKLAVESLA
jgi:hypothetical protein